MIVIIGAGTAGLTAQREVAKVTENYRLIDPGPLGTTCARVGCMPSKALIQIANDFHRRQKWKNTGIQGADHLHINMPEVLAHVRKLRDGFTGGVSKGMKSFEDKFIAKKARFIDTKTLDLEGEQLKFDRAIVATGSTPFIPDGWEMFRDLLLSTDELFEQKDLPKKIAVIGMGVIGLEIGQALHRLGIEIVAFGNKSSIGGASEPQISELVYQTITQELNFIDGVATPLRRNSNGQLVLTAQGQEFTVDKALLAVGRRPRLDLGLENLNIKLDKKGMPEVELKNFSLKEAPHIYFVGDVNGIRPLLHEATDQGFIAGVNATSTQKECFQQRTPLSITFCDPPLTTVGPRYQELIAQDLPMVIGRANLKNQGRALTKLEAHGEMAIFCHQESGQLLGAELFCPQSEHLGHLLSLAMTKNLSVYDLLTMPFYHPVLEEALRSALRQAANQTDQAKKMRIEELRRCMDSQAPIT